MPKKPRPSKLKKFLPFIIVITVIILLALLVKFGPLSEFFSGLAWVQGPNGERRWNPGRILKEPSQQSKGTIVDMDRFNTLFKEYGGKLFAQGENIPCYLVPGCVQRTVFEKESKEPKEPTTNEQEQNCPYSKGGSCMR
jgi:hypothetical protein